MHKIITPTISVSQPDDLIAKLITQFQYDNISKVKFFKIIIESYLDRDERIISIIDEKNSKKNNKTKKQKDRKLTKEIINDFNLNENDINDIFDIISMENPDL